MSNEELGFNIRPTVAVSEVTGYGGGCREVKYEASTKRFGTVKNNPEGVYNLLNFPLSLIYTSSSGTKPVKEATSVITSLLFVTMEPNIASTQSVTACLFVKSTQATT